MDAPVSIHPSVPPSEDRYAIPADLCGQISHLYEPVEALEYALKIEALRGGSD
jgi:hypothetical protein